MFLPSKVRKAAVFIPNNHVENEQQPINIFDFATSELSQDAFLCWLFSHMKNDTEAPMAGKIVAQEFLERILTKYFSKSSFHIDNYRLINVDRQKWNIDILLELEPIIEGLSNISIIIEDKTSSGESRENQLEYYDMKVKKKRPDNFIILVYFKTGYLSSEKKNELEHRNLIVLNAHEIYDIMYNHHSVISQDMILQSWWEHFYKTHYTNVLNIERFQPFAINYLADIDPEEWPKEALKPIFDKVYHELFPSYQDHWKVKCFKVQGNGQISFHAMLFKHLWRNEELKISASLNFILKSDFRFVLVLQIKPEPYESAKELSLLEEETFKKRKELIKDKVRDKRPTNWKIENRRLQSAILKDLESISVNELERYIATNIAELETTIDKAFNQLN